MKTRHAQGPERTTWSGAGTASGNILTLTPVPGPPVRLTVRIPGARRHDRARTGDRRAVVTLDAQSRQRKIYTSLVDKKGVPVATVTPGDLVVREDGVAREILSVAPATDPMRVALLVDNSQNATSSIQFLRAALGAFATRLTAAGPRRVIRSRPADLKVDATTDIAG